MCNDNIPDKYKDYCFDCGCEGLEGGCPSCGREPAELKTLKKSSKRDSIIKSDTILKIPEQYVGVEWHKTTLLEYYPDKNNDNSFQRLADQMDRIHGLFKQGIIPNKSAMIIAPPKYSKLTWAYSCLQYAELKGKTTAPILNTMEVHRLMVLGAYEPRKKMYGMIDYDSYMTAQIVFVTVTKSEYSVDAYATILELIDMRTRLGLPTFIISRYTFDEMSRRDYRSEFQGLLDYNNVENRIKYPIIIAYRDVKGVR